MPRSINAVIEALKNKEENMPIELYQIYLDEETLYLACYPKDIDFFDENGDPQTYAAAALTRSPIGTSTDTKVDQYSVTIDNVTREMSAYIAHTEFSGRKIRILKVFLDSDGGLESPENAVPLFDGIMDAPFINQYQMTVSVVSKLDTLDRELPGRKFGVSCQWTGGFGGEECGFVVPEKEGTIDNISTDHITIYDSDITEEAGYWEYGEIAIGNESRIITESGTGYLEVEYPLSASIEAGDSYNLKAGCDKSFDGPHGCQHWGNTEFYGGFLSIPKLQGTREVV